MRIGNRIRTDNKAFLAGKTVFLFSRKQATSGEITRDPHQSEGNFDDLRVTFLTAPQNASEARMPKTCGSPGAPAWICGLM